MPKARLQATVSGRVQGVGFRCFAQEQAKRLRVTGWVRNTWSREVEVTAEGERDALEQLLECLRRGPRLAHVNRVAATWSEHRGEFDGFDVTG